MWNRFPQQMRRAIAAALRNAGEHGHDSAGPGDLLLAISRDPLGGGSWILRRCSAPIPQIITDIESAPIVGPRRQKAGKLDDSLIRILKTAADISKKYNHNTIGSEHMIVALCAARIHPSLPSVAQAETALQEFASTEMPRAMPKKFSDRLPWPILQLLRLPLMPWRIFIRKSLGHPKFASDPYPLYRWLRQREPVRRDPLAPVWILTRYEDVNALLKDDRYLKDPFLTEHLPREVRGQLDAWMDPNRPDIETVSMLFLDPPEHTRVRSVFTRAFTPRNLADLRPRIEQLAVAHLDAVKNAQEFDLIQTLAYPLPVMVIAEMLGFPIGDYEKIKRWSDDFAASLALNANALIQARAEIARVEIQEYFDGVVADLQKNPRDTLLGRLLLQMDQPAGMTRAEIFSNSVLLLAAGHETTTNLIGNGMLAMLQNPDQWQKLVDHPELIESTVEEMLRFDSPVQWTSRMTAMEMEIGDQKIPEGVIVLGSVGAANRDPARFENPDRFDIQRPDNRHLSFGTGIHFCLGAALARMEAQIAISALANRFPKMRLAQTKLRWMKGLTFRGVKELRVSVQ